MARATKKAVKDDAHVAAYIASALAAPAEPTIQATEEALLAQLVAQPEVKLALTLQEALAESGESIDDLIDNAPALSNAKPTQRRAPRTGNLMLSDEMLAKVRQGDTRQGHGLGLGKDWYKKGIMAPSIRHAALEALCAAADEEGNLTMADALAALQPLKDSGALGCSTPASRITKFIRSGHLLEA